MNKTLRIKLVYRMLATLENILEKEIDYTLENEDRFTSSNQTVYSYSFRTIENENISILLIISGSNIIIRSKLNDKIIEERCVIESLVILREKYKLNDFPFETYHSADEATHIWKYRSHLKEFSEKPFILIEECNTLYLMYDNEILFKRSL